MEKGQRQGLDGGACKAAEIEPLTFHELRHSAASRWARQGLSLAEIAQQLGHADIRMTQRYAHLCQQTLADKIRQMPAMGIYEFRAEGLDGVEGRDKADLQDRAEDRLSAGRCKGAGLRCG